jgi:hypothetical protein
MNPILQSAIASILRWLLALGAGFLVKHGIWSSPDADSYIASGSLAIIALGWSLYEKYKSRSKLLVALTMPVGATEGDVIARVKSGHPTPPISTPANTVPETSKP